VVPETAPPVVVVVPVAPETVTLPPLTVMVEVPELEVEVVVRLPSVRTNEATPPLLTLMTMVRESLLPMSSPALTSTVYWPAALGIPVIRAPWFCRPSGRPLTE